MPNKRDEIIDRSLNDIITLEGGSMVEADGTLSHRGFNQKTVDAYFKAKGLPTKDTRELTWGEAREIFVDEFVNRNGINKIPEKFLPVVLDTAFNSGPGNAAKLLQKMVGAKEDGIIGPKTIEKLNKFIEKNDFLDAYTNTRIDFINNSEAPHVAQYRDGIINRINKVRDRERNLLTQ